MIAFIVSEPVFKTETLFVAGCSFAAFRREMRIVYRVDTGLDVGQAGQMFTFAADPPWRAIWLEHRPTTPARLGVFVHEVVHLATRICQDKGIPIKAQIDEGCGDEPLAYLVDYFVRTAWPHMRASASGSSLRRPKRYVDHNTMEKTT